MSSRVESAYNSLVDELERVFLRIVEDTKPGDTVCVDFIDYENPYQDGRDPGRVIICGDNTGGLEYVYRLRFRAGENERERLYWFDNSFGWYDKQQLVAEKNNISTVLKWAKERVESITEDNRNRILNIFEELETEISNKRQSMDIDDVEEAVKNENIDKLQNIVAPSKRAATEFWKLLFSYDKDGGRVGNPISIEFSGDKVALFSSRRSYNKQNGTRNYALYLAVCLDDISDKFIIKRIRRTNNIEKTNDWDKSDVMHVLGYDIDYRSRAVVDTSKRVKLRGDLRTVPHNYDTQRDKYKKYLRESVESEIAKLYTDMYVDKNDISATNCARLGNGIRIDPNASTVEIKELQDSIRVSEEDIRNEQEKRDIGRLSSNLRAEIVEHLFNRYVSEWMYDRTKPEIESFQDKKRNFSMNRIRNIDEERAGRSDRLEDILVHNTDDLSGVAVRSIVQDIVDENFDVESEETVAIGDTVINFECATTHPRTCYLLKDYKVKSRVIVPENTVAYLNYKNYGRDRIEFNKGVYDLRSLKGMERASF
jgi:hypothetical protein